VKTTRHIRMQLYVVMYVSRFKQLNKTKHSTLIFSDLDCPWGLFSSTLAVWQISTRRAANAARASLYLSDRGW